MVPAANLLNCFSFIHTCYVTATNIFYSNKADLRLLEEMGLTPDESIRQKTPSLRAVGWAVVAAQRMQKMCADWASNVQVQQSLLRKLDQVRGGGGREVRLRCGCGQR